MTSIAEYVANSNNKIGEKDEYINCYEHAGLHIVLKKIIAHDQNLLKNNAGSKNKFINRM